ncbi:hypothetical protein OIE49_36890 [Streptomyces sp. NBC_01788]|uniref:hypothetical protein n=1 Tax=Streptomyces sp. NBC_01788 TaxID=2975940 RepID=UPI002DDC63F1|nr:hypothetical protein [Streptomyces sp. NBC_01788]WSB24481.1 hypothetical protein OIE49_00125 [Streptomyces sp. NBC_01788]WSB30967.1 hypothetical protein OIE49_36890 [Streptomyces sp. NBC_01788]
MARTKLNERQLDALRRICHGETPITSDDSGLAATVYALRNRGLVTTPRTDGRWTAAPTEAGLQHFAHADATPAPPSSAAAPPTAPEAAELISRLQQAGGTLHIANPTPDERARWRRALHTARADHLVPDGHHLQHTGRDKGDLVITLRPGPPPRRSTSPDETVPVPDDLPPDHLHPAAATAHIPACPDCQPRARRILHALCHAAEAKNYTVSNPESGSAASLVITIGDSSFPLSFHEGAYEVPDPSGAKYAWQRVTAHTTRPSHQLGLSLQHTYAHRGRRSHWGDRQRWRLEDKLPALLREIAHRAQTDYERRQAQQRKEEETRQRWLTAMQQARTALVEDHRLKTLRTQVQAWQEATVIRAYCDALEDHQDTDPAAAEGVTAWTAWARAYADRIDPVLQNPRLPDPPTITPEDLRPYLRGWSPYEPKRK